MERKDPEVEPAQVPGEELEVSADTVAELFFDFLRQLSTLSLAAAGGTVTLMQTVFADSERRALLVGGVVALFLAALFALQTQRVLVERLASGTRTLRPDGGVLDRLKMKRTSANEQRLMYPLVRFVRRRPDAGWSCRGLRLSALRPNHLTC